MAGKFKSLRIRREVFGGVGRALANRDYRFYAMGHFAHVHGWWGNRLGIGWLTWELTESGTWLGIVAFAGMMPVMLVAPLAGALADRYGHRLAALLAGIGGSVITLSIATLALTGQITITSLIILSVIQGLIFGVEFPARQSLIPQLVGRANMSAAVAFNATTFQFGAFVGPVIAGVLIVNYGAGAAVLLFAGTTAWMALMVMMIHPDALQGRGKNSGSLLGDVAEGFKYLATDRCLRLIFALSFSFGILVRPYTELMPGFAADVFGRGAEGLSALTAAAGLGSLVTAVILLYRGRAQGLTRIMVGGALVTCVALAAFASVSNFNLALVLMALTSMALLASHVGWQSLTQNVVATEMRGRIISIQASIGVGAPALGTLLLGGLAELIGFQLALGLAAGVALLLILWMLPHFRRLTSEIEAERED